jgi:hypothetical protein
MQISAQQLAELLMGIARAQVALVQGMEKETAHLRAHPEPTLIDLPVRILLATLGRGGPDAASVARDLERLCAGATPTGGPGKDLDFSAPPP